MIEFFYEDAFRLENEIRYIQWIGKVLESEEYDLGDLNYIFCDDNYLLEINKKYLDHDTLTDIITFDYTDNRVLSGDIFISIERVRENADMLNIDFKIELLRVMAHGLLHLMGFNDKNESDIVLMRKKEEEKINMFHVEQS
ncbi:rRNA maturation RNase YbeY [Maribacter polysaccharolyticus]|uniref:rRNA maturation RNase YbeY n=1 Tax=Maribacter polysaccharolyticus TaxID=3020831 RepID=UPI00237F2DBF|nr:rRNA maturation RNase YbeY [Maribacter polysaccharolyticus]MDE3742192.1 rRNA maturation RNase YbeY [Maribacter polysaccharolyticus]